MSALRVDQVAEPESLGRPALGSRAVESERLAEFGVAHGEIERLELPASLRLLLLDDTCDRLDRLSDVVRDGRRDTPGEGVPEVAADCRVVVQCGHDAPVRIDFTRGPVQERVRLDAGAE